MNEMGGSYNDSKKINLEESMKKKKEAYQYIIIREYKGLFSSNELIERIIRSHKKKITVH